MRATLRTLLACTAFVLGLIVLGHFAWHELIAPHPVERPAERPAWTGTVALFLVSPEGRLTALSLAAGFTIAPLLLFMRWLQVHRRAREISYTTENGKVSVSLVAIEEALTRAVENETCVKSARLRLYEDRVKGKVVIEVALVFWEVPNVTERNRQCQAVLRRRFAELMPEQTTVQVNLNVSRIAQRRPENRKADAKPATLTRKPEVDPFVGTPLRPDEPRPTTPVPGRTLAPMPVLAGKEGEDDLYVGPSYPVPSDDEDDSGAQNYLGKPIPVGSKPPPPPVPAKGKRA